MRKWQRTWHHHHHHLTALIKQYLALEVEQKLAASSGHVNTITSVAEQAVAVLQQILAKAREGSR